MKLPLRLIALTVILSLIGVFAYQNYWLVGLYHTMSNELDKTIHVALKNADMQEMYFRLNKIKQAGIHGSLETSAGMVDSSMVVQSKVHTQDGSDSIEYIQPSDADAALFLSGPEYMANVLQLGFHQGIDTLMPPDFACYDSLLTVGLDSAGISTFHYVELIELPRDSVLQSGLTDSTLIQRKTFAVYTYPFDVYNRYAYRVHVEDPRQLVLRQMMGILTTSLLIIILLGCSFAFLLRIIWRQKTVEELKSDFTNNITHELKTPIAVAYAANDAMLNYGHTVNEDKRNQYLHIVEEQLRHLSGLVEQILSMSLENRKNFRLHIRRFPLSEILTPLLEQHKLKARKPVEFDVHFTPSDLIVMADRTHIYNVLSNLIENAVKYSGESVRITISAFEREGKLYISVADNGLGMTATDQKRIFDKFYRVSTGNLHNVKGYGLGLYYVKSILNKHGGDITVESQPGKGSTFTLVIPVKYDN